MTGVKIVFLIEFGAILLAPIIHSFYLWKYKQVEKNELVRNMKTFSAFYMLLGLIGLFLLLK